MCCVGQLVESAKRNLILWAHVWHSLTSPDIRHERIVATEAATSSEEFFGAVPFQDQVHRRKVGVKVGRLNGRIHLHG